MANDTVTMSEYDTSCSPCAAAAEDANVDDIKELSAKPRFRKWALLDKSRRLKASARERKRRHVLNSALERLRKRVPCFDQNPQKLSKIEVLRQAIGYISDLSQCLKSANSPRLTVTALASPVFLEPSSCVEYSNQHQSTYQSLGSVFYGKSMLFDSAQQVSGQSTAFDECFSPETASQYAYLEQTPAEVSFDQYT